MNLIHILKDRLHRRDIDEITLWINENHDNLREVYELITSPDVRTSYNAMWVLTHCDKRRLHALFAQDGKMIDIALNERHTGKRRLLLTLIDRIYLFDDENFRPEFLDFCLTKINSQTEPCGIRSLCIKLAYKQARLYSELLRELLQYLELLDVENLSPGMRFTLKNTRGKINRQLNLLMA